MRHRAVSSLNSNSQTKTRLAVPCPSDPVTIYSRLSSRRCYLFAGVFTATAGIFLARSNYQSKRPLSFGVPHWFRDSQQAFIQWSPFLRGTARSNSVVRSSAPSSSLNKADENRRHSATMYGGGSGVSVPARGDATGCVIFMHGLGDTGAGWASAFPMPNLQHVEVLLPSADNIPITLNGGMTMPGWFDLRGLDESAPEDERGIESAVARVERIIDEVVVKGIPSDRVVVAGFSQGGAVALTAALRTQRKLAGVVALSTWLPMRKTYPQMFGPYATSTPLFIAHGTADQIVPIHWAELSVKSLQRHGIDASLSRYAGVTHSASEPELNDVARFIARVIPPS